MTYLNYDDVLDQLLAGGLKVDTVKTSRGGVTAGQLVVGSTSPVRCETEASTEKRGWYWISVVQFPDAEGRLEDYLIGSYGIYHANDNGKQNLKLKRDGRPSLSPAEKDAMRTRLADQAKKAKALRAAEAKKAADEADRCWRKYVSIGESDYLKRKGVQAHGLRYSPSGNGTVAVPMLRDGRVVGLQIIRGKDRGNKLEKQYWPAGMDKVGAYHLIGGIPRGLVLVAEGYATAATLHETTNLPVAVAFDAGSLMPVVAELAQKYRTSKILICADDDYLTPGNPGCEAARLAATAHGASWCKPIFSEERSTTKKGPTDYNDLAALEGQHVVAAQIATHLESLGWKLPRAREPSPEGGGGFMPKAVSVMGLGDAIDRFIPIDDDQGETLFDNWTYSLVHKKKMVGLLQAGVRFDDVKRDPVWIERGAYYLHQVGFDPAGTDRHIRLNTWRGWPSEPKAGKCERLLDLLLFLCSAEQNSREVFEWILCRIAFSIQFPGKKLPSAIIMHGPQGTGKSTFFKALARIFGDQHPTKNYSVILDQKALQDNFNADWENKLYVLAEEVVNSSDKWQLKNELKELVSGETLRIRKVYRDGYPQKNLLFMVFLSNEKQPLPLDNDDRRHLVVWTPEPASYAFYDDVREEIENGGIEALHQFFFDYDLSKFRPTDRPPMTESKTRLIGLSLPSEVRFVKEYLCGDTEWPVVPSLSADFYGAYVIWCRRNGEKHPRASHQFWGEIERIPGWKKYKQRVFNDLHCIGATTPKNVVIPPAAAMQASGTAKPDAEQMDRWVTHGYIEFRNAGKDAEESKWAA